MNIALRLSSSLVSSRRQLLSCAAAFAVLALPLSAQDEEKKESPFVAVRAADADTFNIAGGGSLQLGLSRAPATSSGAKILVVNSAGYALWQGDLSRSGGQWTAKLDRDAVEALLIAKAVQAEFPGAAKDGKDLRISFVRDVFQSQLGPTASLVGSEALFYEAPQAPVAPEALESGADATRMGSFAMGARRYDEQLAAYYSELVAARASARSLWTDLKTGNRLPDWPATVIAAQDRAFAALDAPIMAAEKQRATTRAAAEAAVNSWNSAHANAAPVELSFRENTE
ncbi:hypothetical protein [Synoicihabitans lomoniglobus]|uniref:Uncharacterized protein n=1 Tax=Synoicihabitans lomoniglobus TaxID=2909285 RepID=A0AAE9ZVC5_9BACT|nr:hypothetical protein [Opitutaceae bacterium LMO-M01]WED64816.1 hypothetical protein PXH66_20925 [Opitutaceae bacterium LMO-M01]